MVSQIHHIIIKALKDYPEDYEKAGKPEPGWGVGIMNWQYTMYLFQGNYGKELDGGLLRKLKLAKIAYFLNWIFLISFFLMIIFSS